MRICLHLLGLALSSFRVIMGKCVSPFRPLKGKPGRKYTSNDEGAIYHLGNLFVKVLSSPYAPSRGGQASFFFASLEKRSETFLRWNLLLVLLAGFVFIDAQDIHFSQFNFSPLNQNPANTNLFDGDYRFVGNYKNQWPAVPVKFNTVSLSAEMNFVTLKNNDRIGGGILFYYDVEGDSRFTTLNTDLSFSYIKALGKNAHHFLSYGLQLGLVNRSFDYSQLNFDSQWNGDVFNPGSSINENFAQTHVTVFDLGTGLAYKYIKDDRTNFTIGFGAMHINSPKVSFLNDNTSIVTPRFTVHTRAQIKVSKKIDIVPEVMYQRQQTKQEVDLGGHIKYHLDLKTAHTLALNLGAYGRVVGDGWLMAGVDYDNWQVNVSYDINFSALNSASQYNGGVELSVIYILARTKKINKPGAVCPTFL
jgi:type IX secretion system PorP/SprF family membrane protein